MKTSLSLSAFIVLSAASLALPAQTGLESDKQKFSYAVGVQLGQNIRSQSIEIDTDALLSGLSDVIKGNDLKLTGPEMQTAAQRYQAEEESRQQQLAEQNRQAEEKFLAENKDRQGVTELASGLQYKVLSEGDGPQPRPSDTVVVHYRGALLDGTEFDSSYSRGEPVAVSLENVIQGWQEALPLMKVGSKWQLFVPAELGYGNQAAGRDIGPNSTLIFDVELLGIEEQ